MQKHRLDTTINLNKIIDGLAIREQLVLRTPLPAIVPRLSEQLLFTTKRDIGTPMSRTRASSGSTAYPPELNTSESYIIMDANHAIKKLQRWRELLPRVKPFFAIKCHPDPVLIKTLVLAGECGFDCASIG